MPSKLALNQQKSSQSVGAAFTTHVPSVASALVEKLRPLLRDGEEMPNIDLVLQLLGRLNERETASLLAADHLLETERTEDAQSRDQRDAASSALYSAVVDLSEDVEFIFGPKARAQLFLSGTTTKDPTALVEQSKRIADALTALTSTAANAPKLPPARRPNIPFDPAARAQQLLILRADLTAALDFNQTEIRETERALLDRDIAVSTQNRAFTRTSTIFEQCCELVGEDELAARIRHTIAKSGNTIEDIDDEASK